MFRTISFTKECVPTPEPVDESNLPFPNLKCYFSTNTKLVPKLSSAPF